MKADYGGNRVEFKKAKGVEICLQLLSYSAS